MTTREWGYLYDARLGTKDDDVQENELAYLSKILHEGFGNDG